MDTERWQSRLGLNVPYEWWAAAPLLKSFEAAGFGWTQVPSPPASVLRNARDCLVHARAVASTLGTTGLEAVVHGPGGFLAGRREDDRAFEGLLTYAAESGARQVVYHARDFPDAPAAEDRALAETRSLARHAARAERLGVMIAIENLAPVFTSPDHLGHTPMLLRSLCKRISSPALGLCLDLGHANIVADLRHSRVTELIAPVLDSVVLFHVHDNLGARRGGPAPPELDPMRLDLHLPPGSGTLPWHTLADSLRAHPAPMILEIHPPHRPSPGQIFERTANLLSPPAPVESVA